VNKRSIARRCTIGEAAENQIQVLTKIIKRNPQTFNDKRSQQVNLGVRPGFSRSITASLT